MRRAFSRGLSLFIAVVWIFSGWPQFYGFPPAMETAAASGHSGHLDYFSPNAYNVQAIDFPHTLDINLYSNRPEGIVFNANGTKMFTVDSTLVLVNEFILDTAYDISTANFRTSLSVSAQGTDPSGMAFSDDCTFRTYT